MLKAFLSVLLLWVGNTPNLRGQVWNSGAKPVGRPEKSVVGLTWAEEWELRGGFVSEVSCKHGPLAWAVAVLELRRPWLARGW